MGLILEDCDETQCLDHHLVLDAACSADRALPLCGMSGVREDLHFLARTQRICGNLSDKWRF